MTVRINNIKTLSKEFIEKLNMYIHKGFISQRFHETLDISILKYTKIGQLACSDKKNTIDTWDDVMMACRGLVIDKDYNIVAEPFGKFFNFEELNHKDLELVKDQKYVIQEKMDGSLIIIFHYKGQRVVATQKTFYSEVAIQAASDFETWQGLNLNENYTYLFEYTSPFNRVVINYGDKFNFTLLAVKDSSQDFKELDLSEFTKFDCVPEYKDLKLNELKALNLKNKEGFVVKFESGFRYKVKFENYLQLHYLLTGMSSKEILNLMIEGNDFAEVFKDTPDEFDSWVNNVLGVFKLWYAEKVLEIKNEIAFVDTFVNGNTNTSKKELALFMINKQKDGEIKNLSFLLSHYGKGSTDELIQNNQKYIWDYLKIRRLDAIKSDKGLLPTSFFNGKDFDFN